MWGMVYLQLFHLIEGKKKLNRKFLKMGLDGERFEL